MSTSAACQSDGMEYSVLPHTVLHLLTSFHYADADCSCVISNDVNIFLSKGDGWLGGCGRGGSGGGVRTPNKEASCPKNRNCANQFICRFPMAVLQVFLRECVFIVNLLDAHVAYMGVGFHCKPFRCTCNLYGCWLSL